MKLKQIKQLLALLFTILALIDVGLAMSDERYATFSKYIKCHQVSMTWLIFLYAGLVAKVYFNRVQQTSRKETYGFLGYVLLVGFIAAMGITVDTWTELNQWPLGLRLLALVTGGVVAYRIWPQYAAPKDFTSGKPDRRFLQD